MPRRKAAEVKESYFVTEPSLELNGFVINAGDIIKIAGQKGGKFKFIGVTTNNLTGSYWVDCFEIINGVSSVFRSFKIEQVKRIPQRRKRVKHVN